MVANETAFLNENFNFMCGLNSTIRHRFVLLLRVKDNKHGALNLVLYLHNLSIINKSHIHKHY
jgi:hypothetical protein